ncbi:RNA binding motif [Gracilaria domingensis]|nr:RNA binding motif [Gracilaria domingensis]
MVPSQTENGKEVDLEAIRTQLEYYFSDSNLPRDKFLRAKTEENEKGYVAIPVLLSFKRLQALGANVQNVIQAVRGSTVIGLDKAHASIRRLAPLPEEDLFPQRAVFVKGWTPGTPEPTLEYFKELFAPSGAVLSVRVRRWKDEKGRHFKGSVFVEMESAEAVERVQAEEYTITVTDESGCEVEKLLLVLPVDEYFAQKQKEREAYQQRKKQERAKKPKRDRDGPKTEGKVNDKATGLKAGTELEPDSNGNRSELTKDGKDRKITPGLVLRFEGFGADISREDIREAFEPHGDIAWVDFRIGDSEGYIRFANEGAAKVACEAMQELKTEFGGKVPTFSVLEGEAEQLYWKHVWEQKEASFRNSKKRRREQGRSGRGNKRFRGRGRSGPRRGS